MDNCFRRSAAFLISVALLFLPYPGEASLASPTAPDSPGFFSLLTGAVLAAPENHPSPLKVSKFTVQPRIGGQFILTLTIKNNGVNDLKDIEVSLNGGDEVLPSVAGGNIENIARLNIGDEVDVNFELALPASLSKITDHPVGINIVNGESENSSAEEQISISVNLEPFIKITEFSVRPRGGDGEFLLNLEIDNKGYTMAEDISVRFDSAQIFPVNRSNLVLIPDLAAGASHDLSLLMKAGARSAIYTATIEIAYRSVDGRVLETSEIITITASSLGFEAQGTPRVMLERHTLSTDQVLAGGTFTLTLFIRNNADEAVGNMKISLANIQVGGETGAAGGSVFSPLGGGSSSFFVDSLAAKGRLEKKVQLYVDPNAAAMTYTLPITIEFEDSEGESFSVSEAVNIPVLQESRIQVLSFDFPPSAMAGEAVPLILEFVNTGKVAIHNVLVAIEGDFPKENATYFVPRLEIGTSDLFQGMIIPEFEGTLSGNLIITYLDARNQEVRLEHPFSIEVGPMIQLPLDPGLGPEYPVNGSPVRNIILGGAAALAVLVTTFFTVKKIKARRQDPFINEKI